MEALRQIASTSLFLENEQNNAENNRIVPTIKEPDKGEHLTIDTTAVSNAWKCLHFKRISLSISLQTKLHLK